MKLLGMGSSNQKNRNYPIPNENSLARSPKNDTMKDSSSLVFFFVGQPHILYLTAFKEEARSGDISEPSSYGTSKGFLSKLCL
jgi:hypothetical protein